MVETWLETNKVHSFNIDGRTFDDTSYGKGKGCGISSLASRKLSQTKHYIAKPKYQTMSIIDETNVGNRYQVVLVCASSGCPFEELVKDMAKILETNLTAIGDFNFDWRENNALTRFLAKKKFTQLVDWPTHIKGNTLDHCYVSNNTRVQSTRHSPYYSDHSALCLEFEHFPWN